MIDRTRAVGSAGAVLALWATSALAGGELSFGQRASLPTWVLDAVAKGDRAARYALCACLNPFYLRGDFDGDGKMDYAILAIEKTSGKRGILIVHAGDRSVHVIGAGWSIGAGGDDFAWMDAWRVSEDGGAPPSARAGGTMTRRDGLVVEKTEAASGLLSWDGKAYRWRQRGD